MSTSLSSLLADLEHDAGTGSFDDLEAIGRLCEHRGVWLHVDGAHGASALLSAAPPDVPLEASPQAANKMGSRTAIPASGPAA